MPATRALAPLALAFLAFSAFASAPRVAPNSEARDTVVLVVRHAEKAGPSGDVPLSPAGEERARALVQVAREAGVSAVITTQFQRTKLTAAPLVTAMGLVPDVVAAGASAPDHARAIADAIKSRHAGKSVLVVGHSNTVPAIVEALGGPKFADLCDDEYDHLFVVVVSSEGPTRFLRSRYGAPSVLGEACSAMKR